MRNQPFYIIILLALKHLLKEITFTKLFYIFAIFNLSISKLYLIEEIENSLFGCYTILDSCYFLIFTTIQNYSLRSYIMNTRI